MSVDSFVNQLLTPISTAFRIATGYSEAFGLYQPEKLVDFTVIHMLYQYDPLTADLKLQSWYPGMA